MTVDIGLHVVGVRMVGARTLRLNQFSRMDSLKHFLTHGAPLLINGFENGFRIFRRNHMFSVARFTMHMRA